VLFVSSCHSLVLLHVVADNNIGDEGASVLGPHLAKLSNMTKLDLEGASFVWCVRLRDVRVAARCVTCVCSVCHGREQH